MSKRAKTILITIIIALVLITLGVILYFIRRIPMNPAGTVGNTWRHCHCPCWNT